MSAALAAHLAGEVTTLAHCFLLTRIDGERYGFTDHDLPLVIDGVPYEPHSGFIPTTTEYSDNLSVDNLDIEAILDDETLKEDEIQAGLFDYASVAYFQVNWRDLTMGRVELKNGTVGEITRSRATFVAEVRGPSQSMAQTIGEVLTPTCRAALGDARCKVDIAALTVAGTVTSTRTKRRREFLDAARTEADGRFAYGLLTWTSGANAGRAQEIKRYRQSSGFFELLLQSGFDIALGDEYTVYPGCDKRWETCEGVFDNALNFRGEPFIPGQDELSRFAGQ